MTQTYQSLQQDPQVISAVLLLELIAVQRAAVSNGSSVNDIPSSKGLDTTFTPSSSDIWINSLWFLSLMLSLLIVLMGVLAKQWLHQYDAVTSGPPRTRALIRQARNLGLHEWHVHTLIGILPIIIHISLALFFAGLVILLRSILPNLACFVAGIVGAVYLAYFISNLLPIFNPRCPYRTSLTPKLYNLYSFLSSLRVRLSTWLSWTLRLQRPPISLAEKRARWRDAESEASTNTRGFMEFKAALWLYTSSFNPTAKQVALEGLAGLQQDHDWIDAKNEIPSAVDALNGECKRLVRAGNHSIDVGRQLELFLRALIQIQRPLLVQNSYEQLDLPSGVEDFCHENGANSRLETLLSCGWFKRQYDPVSIDQFLSYAASPTEHGPSSPQLPTSSWVALLRASPRSISTNSSNGLPYNLLGFISKLLIILLDAQFFASAPTIPESEACTTLLRPNPAMCQALFNAVCLTSNEFIGAPTRLPQDDIPCMLVGLLLWVGRSTTDVTDGNKISAVDVLLSCLLQSVQQPIPGAQVHSLWTPVSKRIANDSLLLLLETKFFKDHVSVDSEAHGYWEILRKTMTLVERICLPADPSATILRSQHNAEMALRVYLYHMKASLTEGASRPWWQHGGLDLIRFEMDSNNVAIYKSIIAVDVIPALSELWSKESQSYDHTNSTTSPSFIKHYLASIVSKDARGQGVSAVPEYQAEHMQYIHTANNLYHLCRILLHSDTGHSNDYTILKLLSLDPENSSWIQCLNMLKEWVPEKDSWHNEYLRDANIQKVYEGITDIQYILGIGDDRLEGNTAWQQRHDSYSRDPDWRTRVSLHYSRHPSQCQNEIFSYEYFIPT